MTAGTSPNRTVEKIARITHGSTDQACDVKFLLANPEPSTHGTFGHGAMSELSPLSGVKQKLDFGAVRAAFDPQRTLDVGRTFGFDGRECYRKLRLEPLCCPHGLSRGTAPHDESIHGEKTASELQDRVTELIEQQTAISEVLRAIANSPHDLQPIFDAILDSATRLCRADLGTYVSPKKAAFVAWQYEGTPFWLVRCGIIPSARREGEHSGSIRHKRGYPSTSPTDST